VLLFALLFLWQLPHVIGLAAFRRDDYVAAGIRVLPAVLGAEATRWHAAAWALVLMLTSFIPSFVGWAGRGYLLVAAALGGVFLASTLRSLAGSTPAIWGRRVFLTSLCYLPLLFAALLWDGRA
jgi:protoheme IX farnesyltransferase